MTIRKNAWTPEDDEKLTQIVLDEVRKGKSQKMAFKKAGRILERTGQACGFRFNKEIRPHFRDELTEAVREGRYRKREIPSLLVEPKEEAMAEVKEQLLSWEKLLAERETRLQEQEEVQLVELETEEHVESFLEALEASTPIKPAHYHKGGIDVIGFLEEHFGKNESYSVAEGFYIGNIFKYVARYKQKNGNEDLEKALVYLNKLKQHRGE